MRPVKGLDQPPFQWLLVALSVVLIALAAWGAVGLRRASHEIERLRAADLEARVEREQLEARLARERSTREALALELARQRTSAPPLPTLTLRPLTTRAAVPPEASVAPPPDAQVIDLRLVLPRKLDRRHSRFQLTMRSWSEGETIWMRGGLVPARVEGETMVIARVAGDVLQPGAYEIALTAGAPGGAPTEVASYEVAVGSVKAFVPAGR